jgi:hypothetical protein
MDPKEIWLRVLDWIHLAQDRDQRQVDSCERCNEASGSVEDRGLLEQLREYYLKKGSSSTELDI